MVRRQNRGTGSTMAGILIDCAAVLLVVAGGLVLVTLLATRRAERLAPPLGQFRDVPGGRIHYTDQGSGSALVLIHGLGGNLRNFAPALVDHLARTHRVIALDRPGSGYSTTSGATPDLHGQAAMVAALIEALDPGPVTLVGHSLGGALSLALVAARPDLVAALALVAPLTQVITQVPAQFRTLLIGSRWLRLIFGWLVIGPAGLFAGRATELPAFAPDPVPPDFESLGGGALLFRPRTFDAASCDVQSVRDVLPAIVDGYSGIARPVAVLFGRGDQILDPALHGQAFATQIPGAGCTLVEGGHMLPFVHPLITAQWIATVAPAGAA
jgi:pimeloyl-ACP methyl ester carboxylesterase